MLIHYLSSSGKGTNQVRTCMVDHLCGVFGYIEQPVNQVLHR